MGRLLVFLGVGLILMSFSGCASLAQEPWPLCVAGRPAHRPPDCDRAPDVAGCVTYGGLRPRRGYERDHYIPEGLCRGEAWCDDAAGDPDHPPRSTADGNVWYQAYPEYKRKDVDERSAERAYCSGRVSLDEARAWIEQQWPRIVK